jgi:uncharacterized iron-regulated membrane protein
MLKNRFWFQAHWLVGISVGVLLAMMGLTGATMSFKDPLLQAMNAEVRTIPANGTRLPMPVLLERAATEAQRQGAQLRGFALPKEPDAAARVTFVSHEEESVRFLNPYTGEWRDGGTRGEAFFEVVEETHRGLITDRIGGKYVGRRILDIAAILLVAMVATGLYLRWPRRVTNWRAWFVIDRRLRGRGFLYSLHAVIGTYVLPLLLLSALTGLYFAYDWYGAMLETIAGVPPAAEEKKAGPLAPPDFAVLWNVFERQTAGNPVGNVVMRFPLEDGEALRVQYYDVNAPHDEAINTIKLDSATAEVLMYERHAEKPAGSRLLASMLAIHKGNFFGVPGMALLMLSSLALPIFVISGWMMYLERRRIEARARKRQATQPAAA